MKEQLAQSLFDHIPVGVGSQGIIPTSAKDLEAALEMGMDWSLREVGRREFVLLAIRRGGCCSGAGLWPRADTPLLQSMSPFHSYFWSSSEVACTQDWEGNHVGAGCVGG